MLRKPAIRRLLALLLTSTLCIALVPFSAAEAKTVAQWLEGYDTGEVWFGEDFAYDITDTAAVWELLMKPITVLDVTEVETVYPLVTPGGKKVNNDKLGGFISGASAAVHVLGPDEDGWTLIEGIDYYNRVIRGYVKTSLLKEVTPNEHFGIVVDKLTQKLYIFVDGELYSSVLVSTGLPNDKQPYNETAAGEYLLISWSGGFDNDEQPYNETAAGEYLAIRWSGGFDSEGMYCDMAIRFNNGDKMHEVPCNILADGTKRYTKWESQLGQKASHGCIRVARLANEDGVNMRWIWENLKRNTKVLVWDDRGREVPYPDDEMLLYYNPTGGQYYHADEYCSSVKSKYLPLTAFTYGELDNEPYADLTACPYCTNVKRKDEIDLDNLSRGAITQEEYDARQAARKNTEPAATPAAQSETDAGKTETGTPASVDDIVITINTIGN